MTEHPDYAPSGLQWQDEPGIANLLDGINEGHEKAFSILYVLWTEDETPSQHKGAIRAALDAMEQAEGAWSRLQEHQKIGKGAKWPKADTGT